MCISYTQPAAKVHRQLVIKAIQHAMHRLDDSTHHHAAVPAALNKQQQQVSPSCLDKLQSQCLFTVKKNRPQLSFSHHHTQ